MQLKTLFITPGSPSENGYNESFVLTLGPDHERNSSQVEFHLDDWYERSMFEALIKKYQWVDGNPHRSEFVA